MFQCVKHKKNCKNISNTHKEGINRGVRYRIRYFIDVYKKRLQGSVNVLQWICSCLSVNLFLLVSGFVPACQWICSCLSVNLFPPVSGFVPACQDTPCHVFFAYSCALRTPFAPPSIFQKEHLKISFCR